MNKKFYRKVLDNGMVVLLEKRDLPIVSVSFGVRQGGINEGESEKGISHFIEHMLYKGTSKRNSLQIAKEIEQNGGILNGFTSEVLTAYWCKIPSKNLDIALDVLVDMIKNPLFDSKELEKERKVIYEEIKMGKDNPQRMVLRELGSVLYGKPFGMGIIGNEKTLSKMDSDILKKKFKEVYNPKNLILCVVGDADFDKIVKFAEKNFKEPGRESVKMPKIKKIFNKVTKKRKGINQANFAIGFHMPSFSEKKFYASQVLITLMTGGMSSRLFNEIREKRNLAYAVQGGLGFGKAFGYGFVYVGTTPDKLEEAKKVILEEFRKVQKELTEEELDRVKEQIIGNYFLSMEDSQSQMEHLLFYESEGNVEDYYNYDKFISEVRLEDVKTLAGIKEYALFELVPEQ